MKYEDAMVSRIFRGWIGGGVWIVFSSFFLGSSRSPVFLADTFVGPLHGVVVSVGIVR